MPALTIDNKPVVVPEGTSVLEAARSHDLVIVNAGSSAGSEDFTARIVQELGRLLVHGIAIRPGHPVILGLICLPGTDPVSRQHRALRRKRRCDPHSRRTAF